MALFGVVEFIGQINLMPWPYLPDNFRENHRSVWVDLPNKLYDPKKGHFPSFRVQFSHSTLKNQERRGGKHRLQSADS